jgi:hypothetical protein
MKKGIVFLMLVLSISLASFGQFSQSKNVSKTAGIPSRNPDVCFGPDGIVHMVWAEAYTSSTSDVMYVNYDGVKWSTPFKITPTRAFVATFPFIASNNKGQMAVIWESNRGETWLREYDAATKTWLPAFMLDPQLYGYLDKPKLVLDDDNNIYTFYFTRGTGWGTSKCRINGVWQDRFRLNEPGLRVKEGGISIGSNGIIWVVYAVKESGGEYKIFYRKRTKDTGWSKSYRAWLGGHSQEQPYPSIGPDNIPRVVFIGNAGVEGQNAINMVTLNETNNPVENVLAPTIHHLPRIAVDNENVEHIATEWGQGDNGLAILYTTKTDGHWTPAATLPNSGGGPKLPGIRAEAFGNVAIVWDSSLDGFDEAWFTSRYPVVVKRFLPPVSLSAKVSLTSAKRAPVITFTLGWAKNPENNDQYIRGYKIYRKAGDGAFEFLVELDKATFTQTFEFSSMTSKVQFAISTVSVTGLEGERVTF